MKNFKTALNFDPNRTVPGWFMDTPKGTKLTNVEASHTPESGEFWVSTPHLRFKNYA